MDDVPKEKCPRGGATKLLQISEPDLAELERLIPSLVDRLYPAMDNQLRTQVRAIQKILVDVRWRYGPPGEVIVIPAGPPDAPADA